MGAPPARGSDASVITSTKHEWVRTMRRLQRARHRREQRLTLVEGPEPVAAALESGADVRWICASAGDAAGIELAQAAGVDLVVVSDAVLSAAAPTKNPRGPLAVVAIPEPRSLRLHDTVVLWEVADPGNVGTLIRSAAAFGFDVATTSGSVDLWSPKVLRAAAGSHFTVGTVAQLGKEALAQIGEAGLASVATLPAGGSDPDSIPAVPIALLIGNEAHGLPPEVAESADLRLTLSMPGGAESLNAAVAGSIAMYTVAGRSPGTGVAGVEEHRH